ncbi:hypothetical protein OPV22_008155 [Ensete ventricosum]|uniref:Uncharacterized protein n=1 Tax=Ensete ventricosum TaxID=4639 RepID=A0AAV8R298_ENSVE|nr:hypothetical protein OPV22_008155 [Ensete ventricosum]
MQDGCSDFRWPRIQQLQWHVYALPRLHRNLAGSIYLHYKPPKLDFAAVGITSSLLITSKARRRLSQNSRRIKYA